MRQVSRLDAAARCAASRRAGWTRSPRVSGPRGECGSGAAGSRTRRSPARRGVEEGAAPGRVGRLASAAFQLPSKVQGKNAGRRARHPEQPLRPHGRLHPLRGDGNSEIYGGSSPSPCVRYKEGAFSAVTFFSPFLVPTVAAALRSRRGRAHVREPGFLRGQAPRDASDAARAPGRSRRSADVARACSRAAGGPSGAGRKSCALPARGRCGPRLRPGPGSGGPGAVPGHRRAAGAPASARSAPFPRRFNSGKREDYTGAFE